MKGELSSGHDTADAHINSQQPWLSVHGQVQTSQNSSVWGQEHS